MKQAKLSIFAHGKCVNLFMKKLIILLTISFLAFAFVKLTDTFPKDDPQYIPPSKQRSGNVAKGYEYLTTGDYLKAASPIHSFLWVLQRHE
jgi:hypothetical protein